MAQDITLLGANYSAVPAVTLPKTGGGTAKFMDTTDANAVAGEILNGKTAYVNGSKITGNISSKAAATITPTSSSQSIASGQYLSGAQTIEAVVCSNLTAANIKSGVTVKVGTATDDDSVTSVLGTLTSPTVSQDGTTKILSIS